MAFSMEISNDTLAEMAYESAMYKLYEIENLMIVRRIWDSIEEDNNLVRTKTIKLDYKR